MSKINVILALELAVAQKLRQNFINTNPDPEGDPIWQRNDLTNAQREKLRSVYGDKFKRVTVATVEYVILNFYFPLITVGSRQDPPTNDLTLHWLEQLKILLPGQEFVLGAWDHTGAQYGMTLIPAVLDDEGNEVTPEQMVGDPVYPVHARLLDIMPDDVTYDENGNETNRTVATEFKQTHKILGWADRRW